jgi:hypothetical protein
MMDKEGTIARPPDAVRCENPQCGETILLDESLLTPDTDTPKDYIHTGHDSTVSAFSALCRHCRHFTVNLSAAGQNPVSSMNSPPDE